MTEIPFRSTTPAFAALTAQLQALRDAPQRAAAPGHCSLTANNSLWLSTDPAGQGALTCTPSAEGFILTLKDGDSGRWASLGFRLGRRVLQDARYFALLTAADSEGLTAYTPTLRYHLEGGGFTDTPAAPAVMAGGRCETLSHIPLDPELLAQSRDCDVNLFFQTASFRAVFLRLEPLVMR